MTTKLSITMEKLLLILPVPCYFTLLDLCNRNNCVVSTTRDRVEIITRSTDRYQQYLENSVLSNRTFSDLYNRNCCFLASNHPSK